MPRQELFLRLGDWARVILSAKSTDY